MDIEMNNTEEMFSKLGMRLGAEMAIPLKDGDNFAPTGCIVTKLDKENGLLICRTVQKEINGTWYTVDLSK